MNRLLPVLAALAVSAATPAFAHNSTAPHQHPHDASMFPDHAAALLIAVVVFGAVIAFRIWRRGGRA